MWVNFLNILGVTPDGEKTGKREASWALIALALVLTVTSMCIGVAMVQAMTAVLMAVWGSAILAVAGAYKLEHDKDILKPENIPAMEDTYVGDSESFSR